MPRNGAAGSRSGHVRRLPREQWEGLIRAAGEGRSGGGAALLLRDQAVVALLAFAGLRCGELAALDVDDVEWTETPEGLRCRLRVTGTAGGEGRPRMAAVGWRAAELLEAYLDARPEPEAGTGEPLFVSRKGGRLTPRQVQRLVKAAGRRAGHGEALRPHTLRHSFAAEAVRQAARKGKSLREVAEQLGHADPATTRAYGRES